VTTESSPYIIAIPVRRATEVGDSYQVRMIVEDKGKTRAKSVSVYAKRLYRHNRDTLQPLDWFIPMDLKWAEDERQPLTGISPSVGRTCNIAALEEPRAILDPAQYQCRPPQAPEKFDYTTTCYAHIHTMQDPSSGCNLVFPGSYRLELVVSAANAESQRVDVDFTFNGQWRDSRTEMFPAAASFTVTTRTQDWLGAMPPSQRPHIALHPTADWRLSASRQKCA
jgi:hypothetical protein